MDDQTSGDGGEGESGEGESADAASGDKTGEDAKSDGKSADDANEDGGVAPTEGVKLPGSNDKPILNEDPVSITDQNFREMEDTFIDSKSREYAYGILRKVDTKNYVIPMDWVLDNMRPTVYADRWHTRTVDYDPLAQEVFSEFRNNNQKYIPKNS
jgi:hypothetical protein